jgi:GxxExxY protein
MKVVFDETSGKVIGAAIAVHKQLGPGFLESVYEQALKIELAERNLRFEAQKRIEVLYKGVVVGTHVLDLFVEDQIVVELKAIETLERIHFAQVQSYLCATGVKVGLLLNFNSPTLYVKRIVN